MKIEPKLKKYQNNKSNVIKEISEDNISISESSSEENDNNYNGINVMCKWKRKEKKF